MKALGEAASNLPWLVPGAAALVQLTRPDAQAAWDFIRFDPAAVCLAVRTPQAVAAPLPALLSQPAILENAQPFLNWDSTAFVDWNRSGPNFVYRKSLSIAAFARQLAANIGRCDPDRAWAAGLLAPLGWLAVCAADPWGAIEQLRDFANHGYCASWQCEKWGLDHAAITRRLSRRWQLPTWLASVVDCLGLPFDIAGRVGADPVLFQVVQLAVSLCQRDDPGLGLVVGTRLADLLNGLDLSAIEANRLVRAAQTQPPPLMDWQPPSRQPLLADLFRLAAQVHRQGQEARPEERLRDTSGCVGIEQDTLHKQKMAAMAELAAGAGHEINNPLAVISGQAQYIARQPGTGPGAGCRRAGPYGICRDAASDHWPFAQDHHRPIAAHPSGADRSHGFARPAPPRPQVVHVREMLREVMAAVASLADARKVRISAADVADSWCVSCDPKQTHTALINLLRNAVDAAPPDGWVGMRAEMCGTGALKLIVEDNGPGPLPAAREHLFDPFYSGRSAGRGRGLGLSIAWRLLVQQSGALSYEGHVDGVTRFAVTLPGLTTSYVAPQANGQRHAVMGESLACAAR